MNDNEMDTQLELLENIAICIIRGDSITALTCLIAEIENLRTELEFNSQ
jgi:hypothetical protein